MKIPELNDKNDKTPQITPQLLHQTQYRNN